MIETFICLVKSESSADIVTLAASNRFVGEGGAIAASKEISGQIPYEWLQAGYLTQIALVIDKELSGEYNIDAVVPIFLSTNPDHEGMNPSIIVDYTTSQEYEEMIREMQRKHPHHKTNIRDVRIDIKDGCHRRRQETRGRQQI